MPGAAGSPKAFQPVGSTFDVVAFDDQRPVLQLHLRHGGRAASLVDMALLGELIQVLQQGLQLSLVVAAHDLQAESPHFRGE